MCVDTYWPPFTCLREADDSFHVLLSRGSERLTTHSMRSSVIVMCFREADDSFYAVQESDDPEATFNIAAALGLAVIMTLKTWQCGTQL